MRKIYEEFTSNNVIGVTLEHNGHNSDSVVNFSIENLSCTNMKVNGTVCDKFELSLSGYSERETLLAALKMAVKELEGNPKLSIE